MSLSGPETGKNAAPPDSSNKFACASDHHAGRSRGIRSEPRAERGADVCARGRLRCDKEGAPDAGPGENRAPTGSGRFVRGRHQPAPWRNPPRHWHAGVSLARSAPPCLSTPSRGYDRSTAEGSWSADRASWRRPVSATPRRARRVCVVNRVRWRAGCARARGSGRSYEQEASTN